MAQPIPPEPSLMFSTEPDPCGVTYSLAYSPLVHPDALGCRLSGAPSEGDLDEDGFWDQAEAELVWAFLPYVTFDEGEQYKNGTVMVVQSRPYWDNGGRMILELRFVFLFSEDCWHRGDSEAFSVRLVSTDAAAQHWRMYHLQFRGESGKCWPVDFTANGADYNLEDNQLSLLCESPFNGGYLRSEVTQDPDFYHRWFYSGQSHAGPRVDSGMIHPKLFISKDKHGLYATHEYCLSTCHSTKVYEDCGGSSAPAGLMLPGTPVNVTDVIAAAPALFEFRALENWVYQQSRLQSGDSYAFFHFVHRANLGEKGHLIFNDLNSAQRPWFFGEYVTGGYFCGGVSWTDVDPSNWPNDCAAGVRAKMGSENPLPDCSFSDLDTDGVPDWLDCEPLNRMLGEDLDLDGFCDQTPEVESCEQECAGAYADTRPWPLAGCLEKCRTPDPCIIPQNPDDYCRSLVNAALFHHLDFRTAPDFQECRELYRNRWVKLSDGSRTLTRAPACAGLWTHYTSQLERISQWVFLQGEEPGTKTWSICSRPLIIQNVLWAGGVDNPFHTGNEEIRPTSLMLCGCDPTDSRYLECVVQCGFNKDPDLSDSRYWHAYLLPPAQWQLPGVFGAVPANLVGAEEARHRALEFTPIYSHRKLTLDWSDTQFVGMHGREVRTRLSFPARPDSYNGASSSMLTAEEYQYTSVIPPSLTGGKVTCREVQKTDLGCMAPGACVEIDLAKPDDLAREISPIRILPAAAGTSATSQLIRRAPTGAAAVALVQPMYDHGNLAGAPIPVFSSDPALTPEKLSDSAIAFRAIPVGKNLKDGLTEHPQRMELLTSDGRLFQGIVADAILLQPQELLLDAEATPGLPEVVSYRAFEEGIVWMAGPVTVGASSWRLLEILRETGEVTRQFDFEFPEEYETSTLWWSASLEALFFIGTHGAMGWKPEKSEWFSLTQGPLSNFGDAPTVQAGTIPDRPWIVNRDTGVLCHLDLSTGERGCAGRPIPTEGSVLDIAISEEGDHLVVQEIVETESEVPTLLTSVQGEDERWTTPTSSDGIQEVNGAWYPQTWEWETPAQPPKTESNGCSCRATSSRSSGFGWVLLLGLLILGKRLLRRRWSHWAAAVAVLSLLSLPACDDSPRRPNNDILEDADADADVVDADADADVAEDLVEYPGCAPWSTTEVVPAGALARVPHAGVDGTPWQTFDPTAYDNWVAFDQNGLWLVDINTMDATGIIGEGSQFSLSENYLVSVIWDSAFSIQSKIYNENNWNIILEGFQDENFIYNYWKPKLGNNFVLFEYFVDDKSTSSLQYYDIGVYYYSNSEKVILYHGDKDLLLEASARGHLAAWCQPEAVPARMGLRVFDSVSRQIQEIDLAPFGDCIEVSFIDGDDLVVLVGRDHRFLYDGTVYQDNQYTEVVVNAVSGQITPVGTDLFYDRAYGVKRKNLLVERDYGVYCMGSLESSWELGYLAIQDLETGVRRPIGIPQSAAVPEDLQELIPLELAEDPWRLIFTDNGSWTGGPYDTRIWVLNLEEAGYVDELGSVIPDPGYPPPPGR